MDAAFPQEKLLLSDPEERLAFVKTGKAFPCCREMPRMFLLALLLETSRGFHALSS
jgi:hypothetical protein